MHQTLNLFQLFLFSPVPALPRKESDSKSGTRPKGMLIDFNEQPKFPAAVQKQTMQENLGKQPRNNVKRKL